MEMTAEFVPTPARAAEHMVHSLSSEQAAMAQQEYLTGYGHGHADGFIAAAPKEEAAFVETGAKAETETESETDSSSEAEYVTPSYVSSNGAAYYGSYPSHAASIVYQPAFTGAVPMPPQLPTWLPPPPYITPVAPAASKK